jgi:hypothetical protein
MSATSQEGESHRSATMTTGELTCSPAGVMAVKKYALASAGGFGAASVPGVAGGDARVIAIAPR